MEEIKTDVVVIGSGPAGQKAAIQASKFGKKAIIIEKSPDPGGGCLFAGTIPSKTLRESIIDLTRFYERRFFGPEGPIHNISIEDLQSRLGRVIEEEKTLLYRQFRRNNIRLIQGVARFENPNVIVVMDAEYRLLYQITADKIVIATGSIPRNPLDVPFDKEVILDSTRLLRIKRIPKSLIVLGGGVIGSEYASFFSTLGTEVTIVDKMDHLLPFLDSEIGLHLQTALTDIGLKFLGNKIPKKISRMKDKAFVEFEDGTSIEGEVLLYSLGRSANVKELHIENIGIETDQKGYIPVNALFQTVVPHIYAAGDVIGGPCLASTSMEQGRLAARHACGEEIHYFPTFYPIGIYSIPEISCCGYTEDNLRKMGFNYEVGRAYYYEIARSHIAGGSTGMIKLIFHAETLEILGVHVIGRAATEIIHVGQMAISFHARVDYFVDHIFNYPTYAEGYRVAALNGLNKIKHKK
ncbi:MAG: putative soluble pyridine nucleotide transhydrogenase [Chlamydiae bacterium]|nr:putative soluble pyridine nucleotide transhydrogenase [Chlamydiota bacterium]